jgi:hypothetical protein
MAILIRSAERVDGGLAVEFSDGETILYSSEFLYEHRERSGNSRLVSEPDEDWYG